MRKKDKRILDEAIAQLKQQGLAEPVPQEVLDATMRRIAGSDPLIVPIRNPRSTIRHLPRLAVAAALVIAGYAAGRLSAPVDVQGLRDALTPAVAASLEPVLRRELGNELKDEYQLALSDTCVRLKDDLMAQYREDLNRFAIQTLAASNAATNELLAGLVRAINTAQAQDQRRVAQALYEIESKRVQDQTQLAAGLQTLAYRTNDELSRTKTVLARLLVDVQPQQGTPTPIDNERSNQ
jgi:hypothetical protein